MVVFGQDEVRIIVMEQRSREKILLQGGQIGDRDKLETIFNHSILASKSTGLPDRTKLAAISPVLMPLIAAL